MNKVAPYAKAIVGALVACLSYLQPAVDDGLSASEVVGAAIALLSGLALVWAIPNKDPDAEHQEQSVQPPDTPVEDAEQGYDGFGAPIQHDED